MPESKHSPRRLQAAERQTQALELRKAGVTYDAIAQRLGYKGAQGAYEAISAALLRTQQEPAEEVRQLELGRLDKLLTAIWPAALKGEYPAVDRVLKIMERRACLQGLDAPRKLDVTYQLRQMALADGLDPDEMVRAAELILQTGG
jgi:hypothetical protein